MQNHLFCTPIIEKLMNVAENRLIRSILNDDKKNVNKKRTKTIYEAQIIS